MSQVTRSWYGDASIKRLSKFEKADYHFENAKLSEAVVQRCSVKKTLLKISENSQENTCARDFFIGTGVFLWVLRNF